MTPTVAQLKQAFVKRWKRRILPPTPDEENEFVVGLDALLAAERELPSDVRDFIYHVTIALQEHRSKTDTQKDQLFQDAYVLYCKYDVRQTLAAEHSGTAMLDELVRLRERVKELEALAEVERVLKA